MPTRDRRRFVAQAIRYFCRQDYPHTELILVDDGTDPIGDLVPSDPSIAYVRLPEPRSIGWKRNLANQRARGSVIVHWDDDDWYGPSRVRYQVDRLLAGPPGVCGLKTGWMFDLVEHSFW